MISLNIRYEIVTFQKYFWLRKALFFCVKSLSLLSNEQTVALLRLVLMWPQHQWVSPMVGSVVRAVTDLTADGKNCLQKIWAQLHGHIPLRDHKIPSVPQECCQGEKDYLAVPRFWTTWWAGKVRHSHIHSDHGRWINCRFGKTSSRDINTLHDRMVILGSHGRNI